MNPIELYNELRFKGYFDYNLFSKVINQKYDPKGSGSSNIFNVSISQLEIMDGEHIAGDSFVDSDEKGNEMYGYILLLPKGVGDNWYKLELYFHMYDKNDGIEIELSQMESLEGGGGENDYYYKGMWLYDVDKPLKNILLNWLNINPLEVKQ